MKKAQSAKVKKQAKKELSKILFQQSPKWIEPEREAIQDYLTGDVPDHEVEAATCYEFARESKSFRYAAVRVKKDREDEIFAPFSYLAKGRPHEFDFQILQWPWLGIWRCKSFPLLPWTKLHPEEKREISHHFEGMMRPFVRRPFNALDVEILAGMRVVNKLQELADDTAKKRRADWREKPVLASVQCDPLPNVEHIVFTLNYRGGKNALIKGFKLWLESNRADTLDTYYKREPLTRGVEGSLDWFKTALKQLTAARLHETLGFKEAKAWTKQNHKKTSDGRIRPYFRQKPGKRLNKGVPLFDESRQWKDALRKSRAVMKTIWNGGLT